MKGQEGHDTTSDSSTIQKSLDVSEETGASPPLSPFDTNDRKHIDTLAREISTDSLDNTQGGGQGVCQTDTTTIPQDQVAGASWNGSGTTQVPNDMLYEIMASIKDLSEEVVQLKTAAAVASAQNRDFEIKNE